MSLDVHLSIEKLIGSGSGIFIREDGRIREVTRAEWDEKFPNKEPVIAKDDSDNVFHANITHNLSRMAKAANLENALWQPEQIEIVTAYQLIEPLTAGLMLLKSDPECFKTYNPSNGWGTYEGLIAFIEEYLEACKRYPMATVSVSR